MNAQLRLQTRYSNPRRLITISLHVETDRAVDPVVTEARPPNTKQLKKSKINAKMDQTEDVATDVAPVSHPSHGNTPGQVSPLQDHLIP